MTDNRKFKSAHHGERQPFTIRLESTSGDIDVNVYKKKKVNTPPKEAPFACLTTDGFIVGYGDSQNECIEQLLLNYADQHEYLVLTGVITEG